MTCIYNGTAEVEANSKEEALKKVQESLDNEGLKGFPCEVSVPFGSFAFGEATADYVIESNDETEKKICPECGFEFTQGDGNAEYCYENGATYYTCPECGWECSDDGFDSIEND